MKIVFQAAEHIQLQPLAAAFTAAGDTVLVWDQQTKSVYDMLDEIKPDVVVFAIYQEVNSDIDIIQKAGCQVIELNQIGCANIAQFWKGNFNPKYQTDVLYISNKTPTSEMMIALMDIRKQYKLRIIGHFYYPMPEYVGKASIRNIADSIKSCDTLLDFDGRWRSEAMAHKKNYMKATQELTHSSEEQFTSFGLACHYLRTINMNSDYLLTKQQEIMSV